MKPTPRLRLMIAAAAALYPLAVALGNPLPAIAATGCLLGLANARWRFGYALRLTHPKVRKVIEPDSAREGEDVQVAVAVDHALIPGTSVAVVDDVPPGVEALTPASSATVHYRYLVRIQKRGRHEWTMTHVQWADDSGFWTHAASLQAPAFCETRPAGDSIERGRHSQRRLQNWPAEREEMGIKPEEFELRTMRPFAPGDRSRDVDWKRLSRGRGLLSKEYEKEGQPRLWILMDGQWTMRSQMGGRTKFDHALGLAASLLQDAVQKGLPAGFAIYDASAVIAAEEPAADPRMAAKLLTAAAELPPGRDLTRRPLPGSHGAATGDFLNQITLLLGRSARGGLRQVVERMGRGLPLRVVAFTDAHGLGSEFLDALTSISQRGYPVTAAFLPDDEYFEPPTQPTAHDLLAAARERRKLAHAKTVLERSGAIAVVLTPKATMRTLSLLEESA